jgi:hypothetical protein
MYRETQGNTHMWRHIQGYIYTGRHIHIHIRTRGPICLEGHLQGMHAWDACPRIYTWGHSHRDTHGDTCTEETQGKYAWGDIHTGGHMPERIYMHRGTKTYGGQI